MLRFLLLFALLLGVAAGPPAASAQAKPAPAAPRRARKPAPAPSTASFFTTYTYQKYVIYDSSNGPEPIVAEGVGGTLTLRPDGNYEKHLQLIGNGGPVFFRQQGRYTFSGDSIRFAYTDARGAARTDRGAFRFDARRGTLELTIAGFPAGNRGVYSLRVQPGSAKK